MASPFDTDRRDFLKWAGFSFTALALSGCERAPQHEAVPFLDKPEEVTPGQATWYATTAPGCTSGCGVLAKYRDGRPIKVEGNVDHPVSRGGTCAACQASMLSLYDSQRLRAPRSAGAEASWATLDKQILEQLAKIKSAGGAVRILSSTTSGPTRTRAIKDFLAGFADGKHVTYDALSNAALLDAHAKTFGKRVLPRMRFDRARVIVSFDADFLGTWISPVEFTRDYQAGRDLEEGGADFSRHVQIESRLSLTGCSADERFAVMPSERDGVLAALAERVAAIAGVKLPWPKAAARALPVDAKKLDELATALWAAPRGRSLVVCGANRLGEQTVTAFLNQVLGNYAEGGTLDLVAHANHSLGDDAGLARLLADLEGGKISALIIADGNPVYDLPNGEALAATLRGPLVPLSISMAGMFDETAAAVRYVCPDHHAFEQWDDGEPWAGVVTTTQPVIQPLGDTRPCIESLAVWAGKPVGARDQMRATWRAEVLPRHKGGSSFERFWSQSVHDGFARVRTPGSGAPAFRAKGVARSSMTGSAGATSLALVLYPKVAIGDGRGAHNPWLQELPDPLSKISWDNYAVFSPARAGILGVETGDVVVLTSGDMSLKVPALVQPGQPDNSVALALGYGRAGTDRFAGVGPEWIESTPTVEDGMLVGVNGAPFISIEGGYRTLDGTHVTVEKTAESRAMASSQLYHSLKMPAHLEPPDGSPRPIAESVSLAAWRMDAAAGSHTPHPKAPLWDPDHKYDGHHWDMAIDLSRCTGCSACVIGCQAENNIPVVGKDEMRRQRDMHWIRIDRYFDSDDANTTAMLQPMMCQQCDNAPCETVCPVLATVHSSEGLNQQIYNRCVGTRYCSNNCPYKVRRFNWFTYLREDKLQNMALNPDVTVRTRGVMEKCTFCVQRLQEGKQRAKSDGRPVADADVQPACMQACSAGAIAFGDRNDEKSRVVQLMKDKRTYRVLEDLNVDPSVHYLRRVRNAAEGNSHD